MSVLCTYESLVLGEAKLVIASLRQHMSYDRIQSAQPEGNVIIPVYTSFSTPILPDPPHALVAEGQSGVISLVETKAKFAEAFTPQLTDEYAIVSVDAAAIP